MTPARARVAAPLDWRTWTGVWRVSVLERMACWRVGAYGVLACWSALLTYTRSGLART
jgi:hypothetical protein